MLPKMLGVLSLAPSSRAPIVPALGLAADGVSFAELRSELHRLLITRVRTAHDHGPSQPAPVGRRIKGKTRRMQVPIDKVT